MQHLAELSFFKIFRAVKISGRNPRSFHLSRAINTGDIAVNRPGRGSLPAPEPDSGAPRNANKAPGLATRSANGASEGQSGGSFESLVMVLHWQAPVARRAAATHAGCHLRVLTGTKTLYAGLMAAAAARLMEFLATVTRRR